MSSLLPIESSLITNSLSDLSLMGTEDTRLNAQDNLLKELKYVQELLIRIHENKTSEVLCLAKPSSPETTKKSAEEMFDEEAKKAEASLASLREKTLKVQAKILPLTSSIKKLTSAYNAHSHPCHYTITHRYEQRGPEGDRRDDYGRLYSEMITVHYEHERKSGSTSGPSCVVK